MPTTPRYEEWLTTVANTRLLYNTLSELEAMLDAPSIHSNGIRRCFVSEQRIRSAFRDLQVEVSEQTHGIVKLDVLMRQYRRAWQFYRDNLSRRSNPTEVALQLLTYCYRPDRRGEVRRRLHPLFEQVKAEELDELLLVAMLCRALPGYDSSQGDVEDFQTSYLKVLDLLDRFTAGGEIYASLPVVSGARQEPKPTRLMLIYRMREIRDTYQQYAEQESLYTASQDMKACCLDLDIAGFWNTCEGTLAYTDFWQVEEAINAGSYFATHWHKDAQDCITGTRYTLFLLEGIVPGTVIAYVLHPEAIHTRMQGFTYGDRDHVWYQAQLPDDAAVKAISFDRRLPSEQWPQSLQLTRVTEAEVQAQYEQWLDSCRRVKLFADLEYDFRPSLYAVTQEALYIPTGEEKGGYYRVPRHAFEGCERIQIGDMVGTLTMGVHQYLAFDEFLLYIPTSKAMLQRYGITKVAHIL